MYLLQGPIISSAREAEALADDNSEHDNCHRLVGLVGRWRLRDTVLCYRVPGDQPFSGKSITITIHFLDVEFSICYHPCLQLPRTVF